MVYVSGYNLHRRHDLHLCTLANYLGQVYITSASTQSIGQLEATNSSPDVLFAREKLPTKTYTL